MEWWIIPAGIGASIMARQYLKNEKNKFGSGELAHIDHMTQTAFHKQIWFMSIYLLALPASIPYVILKWIKGNTQ